MNTNDQQFTRSRITPDRVKLMYWTASTILFLENFSIHRHMGHVWMIYTSSVWRLTSFSFIKTCKHSSHSNSHVTKLSQTQYKLVCLVLKQEVVDPKVIVSFRDQHVGSGFVQPPAQKIPPSVPLLKLLLTVSEVTTQAFSTTISQPVNQTPQPMRMTVKTTYTDQTTCDW